MAYSPSVLKLNDIVKGKVHRMVSGCYTLSSCLLQFLGALSDTVEENGFGHWLWEERVDKNDRVVWSWSNDLIFKKLQKEGYKLSLRNWSEFIRHFGYEYEPNLFSDVSSILDVGKEKWHFPCKWGTAEALRYTLGDLCHEAEADERSYIQKIQQQKGNQFYFINYNHYHIASQWGRNILEFCDKTDQAYGGVSRILSNWDFAEPDSIFWIYGDHGPWLFPTLDRFPEPVHFYTWAIIRNNTGVQLETPDVLSIQDFPSFIESLLSETSMKANKNRLFLTEDGRDAYSKMHMSTAIGCRINDDKIDCTWYHKNTNEWKRSLYLFRNFDYVEYKVDVEVDTREEIINSFGWME